MIGLLLIYIIGRVFFDLAKLFDKNKWLFAFLGVLSYYFGITIAGLFIAVYYDSFSGQSMDDITELTLNLLTFPFGILACFIFYAFLKNSWIQVAAHSSEDILDDNFTN